jgi:hypothetical protein
VLKQRSPTGRHAGAEPADEVAPAALDAIGPERMPMRPLGSRALRAAPSARPLHAEPARRERYVLGAGLGVSPVVIGIAERLPARGGQHRRPSLRRPH